METERIKKIYAWYSDTYDAMFKRFFFPRISHAISCMEIKSGERVLDVGVGTGLSLPLYPKGATVVGIDLSCDMLRKAKEKIAENKLEHTTVAEMDAMSLAFEDDSFDKVFISHVVSVVPDPSLTMSEVRRVCKNGGGVVVVNHFRSKNPIIGGIEKMLDPLCRKIGWRSDFCIDDFIEGSGLKVDKVYKLKKRDLWHLIFAINEK